MNIQQETQEKERDNSYIRAEMMIVKFFQTAEPWSIFAIESSDFLREITSPVKSLHTFSSFSVPPYRLVLQFIYIQIWTLSDLPYELHPAPLPRGFRSVKWEVGLKFSGLESIKLLGTDSPRITKVGWEHMRWLYLGTILFIILCGYVNEFDESSEKMGWSVVDWMVDFSMRYTLYI